MGMGFAGLAGKLLPERTPGEAAALLSVRHAGITVALLLIAPIAAAQLDNAVEDAKQRTAAVVLDAKLPPQDKIALVGPITGPIDPVAPRKELRKALDSEAGKFSDGDQQVGLPGPRRQGRRHHRAGCRRRLPNGLPDHGGAGFIGRRGTRAGWERRDAPVGSLRLFGLGPTFGPPVGGARPGAARGEIANPCAKRDLPHTGGITGFAQDFALVALDRAACKYGSSREELAIALADKTEADKYEREHGVNPRSLQTLLSGALGGKNPIDSVQQMLQQVLGGG